MVHGICPNPEGISASAQANTEYCQGPEMVRRVGDSMEVEMCGVILASLMAKHPGDFEVVPDSAEQVVDIRTRPELTPHYWHRPGMREPNMFDNVADRV